jgi:hypothetical protein
MTTAIFGSERAPGISDLRPLGGPDVTSSNATAAHVVCLFGLDHLPSHRRMVCLWYREPDGRLACMWEPDIVRNP